MIIKPKDNRKVHLRNEVIYYKTQGELQIQLTMLINFISSREKKEMYAHSDQDSPLISKLRGIFTKLLHERFGEIIKRWKNKST